MNKESNFINNKDIGRKELQRKTISFRKEINHKKFLGEIIEEDRVEFEDNNLIISPVGSGKSFLIESTLIPEGFKGKALYITSNTALKDSVCPPKTEDRKELANDGRSIGFFTSGNKDRFGTEDYSVHVMTYNEFGNHLESPHQTFTDDIDLIFCDEIHSLPTYQAYDNSLVLDRAMRWLFLQHHGKKIFYFTATEERLLNLEERVPGYLSVVTTYDYSTHSEIKRYVADSTYMISHIEQLRPHLKARHEAFEYYGYKGLAFTSRIEEMNNIYKIIKSEGFRPIMLWSVHNEDNKMTDEQLRVREYVLKSGYIPEPYNFLIINSAMQEGWNLEDDMMRLAVLDTVDLTEQIQSLGRIRRDIELVVKKTLDDSEVIRNIEIPNEYIGKPLLSKDKKSLYERLNIINKYGTISKWPTIKKLAEESGYVVADKLKTIDGKRRRVSVIDIPC